MSGNTDAGPTPGGSPFLVPPSDNYPQAFAAHHLQEALLSPTQDKAREAVSAISAHVVDTLRSTEESGERPDDPASYTLRRVIVDNRYGTKDVTYVLEPPQQVQTKMGISVAYITRANTAPDLELLDNSRAVNPYYQYAKTYTRSIDRTYSDQQRATYLSEVGTILKGVTEHGIRTESVLLEVTDAAHEHFDSITDSGSLPFTGSIPVSSPDDLKAQYDQAQATLGASDVERRHDRRSPLLATTSRSIGAITVSGAGERLDREPIKPLPEKPLADCHVEDLKDLTEAQLAELLFRSSIYATYRKVDIHYDPKTKIHYTLEVDSPSDDKDPSSWGDFDTSQVVVSDLIERTIASGDLTTKEISIKAPYIRGGGAYDLKTKILPTINEQLAAKDLPQITFLDLGRHQEERLGAYWSSDPRAILRNHDYGDGGVCTSQESLEGLLAKEVRDLVELGLDFDDITSVVNPLVADIKTAMLKTLRPSEGAGTEDLTDFQCTGVHGGLPTLYTYVSTQDPNVRVTTQQWKYNVVSIPFPYEQSVFDHEVSRASEKGWNIRLPDASVSLYEHRVIEGHYSPQYRVSAARAVWALEIGDNALQAKAFGLDWQNTTVALERAVSTRDKVNINVMMNYIIDHFPRDDRHWREHGFSGYQYRGTSYDSLRSFVDDLREQVADIPFPPRVMGFGSGAKIKEM